MMKILFTTAMVAALSACGGEGGSVDPVTTYDGTSTDPAEMLPCPELGEILPIGMKACLGPDGEVRLLGELVYDDGCVVVRVGDGRYARPGEAVVEEDPCSPF